MKFIALSIALIGLSACSLTNNETAENGVKPMKQYSSIEQVRCPKSRYHSVKKRLECKHEVREELNKKEAAKDETY
jgi:hypothetical protein